LCRLDVGVGTTHHKYVSGSSTNQLSGAAPVGASPWDGGAVGCFTDATGALKTNFTFADPQFELAEAEPPPSLKIKPATLPTQTSAVLSGEVNPNGLSTQYYYEYGLTSSYGTKTPVPNGSFGAGIFDFQPVAHTISGLQQATTYHFRLVAQNSGGTNYGPDQTFSTPAWKILATPNPPGASDSQLYDVSCEPSTSVCTAVGKSTISGADSPVAQRWNGTSWSEQSPAKKSGTLPTRLFGVDCPSETRCIAVGNYQSSQGPATLAELWNENKWSVQTTPAPPGATSSELVGVGCNSTANCVGVGSAVIGGVKTAIAEKWVSPAWSLESIPIPEGATSSQLDGVDCIWSNFCVAVGRYTATGGSVKSLLMSWNGTSWSLQALTAPAGAIESTLRDVSCTKSPSRCTAVGSWRKGIYEEFTLAYRFNGSTWTLQATPNPSGSNGSVFQDVSCATETSCTGVGSWINGLNNQALAAKWDGSSWSMEGVPIPAGATSSPFFGVSCRSTTCMGAGWSTDASGVDTTLVEVR